MEIHECYVEIFTVYKPNMEGIPRKYLISQNSLKIMHEESFVSIEELPTEDKELFWFTCMTALGKPYLQSKLEVKPIAKPPTAKGKYHSILDLERMVDPIEPTSLTMTQSSISDRLCKKFINDLRILLKNESLQESFKRTVLNMPKSSDWEISYYNSKKSLPDLYLMFTLDSREYLLTQEPKVKHIGLPPSVSYQNPIIQSLAHLKAFYTKLKDLKLPNGSYSIILKDLFVSIRKGNSELAASIMVSLRHYLEKISSVWTNPNVQDPKSLLETLLSELDKNKNGLFELFIGKKVISKEFKCGVKVNTPELFVIVPFSGIPDLNELNFVDNNCSEFCPIHNKDEMSNKITQIETFPKILILQYDRKSSISVKLSESYLNYGQLYYKLACVVTQKNSCLCRIKDDWFYFKDRKVKIYVKSFVQSPCFLFYEQV